MREILVVNRAMVAPLHSRLGWFPLLGFSVRAMAHVLSGHWALFLEYCRTLLCFVIGIVVCQVALLSSFEQLYGEMFTLLDRAIILFCVMPILIRVIN